MTEKPVYPPREGDLPREELMRRANLALEHGFHGLKVTEVWFKYTCPWCGERCTLEEPGVLYENGICHKCGKSAPIKVGGFTLHLTNEPL